MIEIRTGSDSDLPKIRPAFDLLEALGIPYSARILSAHRTPKLSSEEARALESNGFRACIAAAGGAAHLPGTTAAETVVPVLGIPVSSEAFAGLDALYAISQMPDGIPVGTIGVNQAEAAAMLAAEIAGLDDARIVGEIRKRRKLPEMAPPAKTRIVAILKPAGAPEARVADLVKLLKELGVEPRDYAGSSAPERDGARVVVALADEATLSSPAGLAARTHLPVIGVPLAPGRLAQNPYDALLGGAPVAGMGVNRVKNAAIFAASIVGVHDPEVRAKVRAYRESLGRDSQAKDEKLRKLGVAEYVKGMK
jgi:phosphoribosylaminoimidazole carboxylase PurE protein